MFLLFPIFLSSSFYPTKIYIPICFYYFDGPADGVALTMEFTFQYVSIISLPEPVQNFVLILFTFQYVSIISSSSLNSLIVIIPIYIPICFYYFTRSEWVHRCWWWFTFQYVSIISIKKRKKYTIARKFTFQYVSIISGL